MVYSPMSSLGMNVRPTRRFNGNVKASTAIEIPAMTVPCASDHSSEAVYHSSTLRKNQLSFVLLSLTASVSFRKRELNIGVSVKLTSIDTMIENAIVQPNG